MSLTCLSLSRTAIVLTLVFVCLPAPAQQKTATAENAPADEARRQKAYQLLESLADQLSTLQSTENRARLASNLAGSLWPHDERRARTLMVSVENDIRTGLQNADSDDSADMLTRMVFLQLRVDTVERIARHDAELALAFFRATEVTSDKPRNPGMLAVERGLELRLADQISVESPEVALKLARRALARGFSYDLAQLLPRLNKKHREQAQILYKEIVARVKEAKLSSEEVYFVTILVRSFRPPQADELTYRDLISALISTALENGCGTKLDEDDQRAVFCSQLSEILPQMEKVDPARAARLKQWASEDDEPDWAIFNTEVTSLREDGTVEEILSLASKYPQLLNQIYWQALDKAFETQDLQLARKIVSDFPGPSEIRQQMLAQIEARQKIAARQEALLSDVERALTTIPRIQSRIDFLFNAANRVGANDRNASLKLLDKAGAMIDTLKPGAEQTGAQVVLAMMYCMNDSDRGLAIMDSLLPKINELIAATMKLDGYETYNVREGEWNMSGTGTVGNLLTVLAQNAGYFAWVDFERAVSITGQFERPEIRMMAQMKLAQSILAGRPKRLPVTWPNQRRDYSTYSELRIEY